MALYWHVHHKLLLEDCWNYEERKAYILAKKPKEEHELRLRLMRPVQDVKAVELVLEAYDKAVALAREVRNKTIASVREAREKAVALAQEDYYKAFASAWEDYNKAVALAWEDYYKAVTKIHQKECPNCPWNGETIFP